MPRDGVQARVALAEAGSLRLERAAPVRQFASYRGQRHLPGRWWSATDQRHVGYESWLERDHLSAFDFDPEVVAIASQSTGYCPDVTSWPAVQAALDLAGVDHPHAFTYPIVFRRCPQCRQRNVVKDDHFVCALCDAPLPSAWNMDQPEED